MRGHFKTGDYEVDGTNGTQNFDLCKEANTASPTSSAPEGADDNQVRSDGAKREHRERRERRAAASSRAGSLSAKRLRPR
jgi:hypothetical protein